MSQMLKDQEIIEHGSNGTKLLRETMSDGSSVFNVTIREDYIFYCTDEEHAYKVFNIIDESLPCKIH